MDCLVCKEADAMKEENVARFGIVVRVLGILFIIAGAIGAVVAGVIFIEMASSPNAQGVGGAVVAVFDAIGTMFALIIALISGILILLGWLFCRKRLVFLCSACGIILEKGKGIPKISSQDPI